MTGTRSEATGTMSVATSNDFLLRNSLRSSLSLDLPLRDSLPPSFLTSSQNARRRLAKVSRGWVLGCRELATNLPFQGVYSAHTNPTVVYYVPASALAKLTPERSAMLWKVGMCEEEVFLRSPAC